MSEIDKLESALWTALARSVTGRSRDLFYALDNLRVARDLADGRLMPDEKATRITGSNEFYEESLAQAHQVLGIAPAR